MGVITSRETGRKRVSVSDWALVLRLLANSGFTSIETTIRPESPNRFFCDESGFMGELFRTEKHVYGWEVRRSHDRRQGYGPVIDGGSGTLAKCSRELLVSVFDLHLQSISEMLMRR